MKKEYSPGKRIRSSSPDVNITTIKEERVIDRRTKRVKLTSDEEKTKDFDQLIRIPQVKPLYDFDVKLVDIHEMSLTISPKESTIHLKQEETSNEKLYFRDATNFYSWKKQRNIEKTLSHYYSKLTYNYDKLKELPPEKINLETLISKIKNKHLDKPVPEKNEKSPITIRKPKFKRRYISQNIKTHLINCINEGIPVKELSLKYGLAVREINQIYKRSIYKQKNNKKGYFKVVTQEHVDLMYEKINEKDHTIEELREEIKKKKKLKNISYGTVRVILKKILGLSYRVNNSHNPQRYYESIRKSRIPIFNFIKEKLDECIIIFIDETGYNTNMRPKKSWHTKSKKHFYYPSSRLLNASLICAISKQFGVMGGQVLLQGAHHEDYEGFLCNLIKEWNLPNMVKEIILFHDNVNMHNSAHKLINGLGIDNIQCVFNAKYSPMLNPIETFFAVHKRMIRKLMPVNTRDLLIKIFKCLDSISYNIINNIINSILKLEENIYNIELI